MMRPPLRKVQKTSGRYEGQIVPKTVKLWSHIVTTLAHMDHFHAAKAAPVRRVHALLSHYRENVIRFDGVVDVATMKRLILPARDQMADIAALWFRTIRRRRYVYWPPWRPRRRCDDYALFVS
jgi:hypothetical protein